MLTAQRGNTTGTQLRGVWRELFQAFHIVGSKQYTAGTTLLCHTKQCTAFSVPAFNACENTVGVARLVQLQLFASTLPSFSMPGALMWKCEVIRKLPAA